MESITIFSDTDGKIPLSVNHSGIFSRHTLLQLSKLRVFTLNVITARPTHNTANVLYTNRQEIEFSLRAYQTFVGCFYYLPCRPQKQSVYLLLPVSILLQSHFQHQHRETATFKIKHVKKHENHEL